MPWLASSAAASQGKALVEVCTAYGMALVPADGSGGKAPTGSEAGHAADHCALNALSVLIGTAAGPGADGPVRPLLVTQRLAAGPGVDPPDAAADWLAQHHHGPPGPA